MDGAMIIPGEATTIMAGEGGAGPAPLALIRAAGIMLREPDGRVLFVKRSAEGDHAGEWCFPGGKIEDGETAEQAAIRETMEEVGRTVSPRRVDEHCRFIREGVDFSTFVADSREFSPTLNEEHTGWAWADPASPPEPLHPGVRAALAMLTADELTTARLMAFEGLASPQTYKNVHLFDMRITGTGASYRAARKGEDGAEDLPEEFVWRDPALCCNEEFLARCNGLPVIFEHPKKRLLNSKEYGDRVVGSVFLPYIRGEEVWAIVKVWDTGTAELMANVQMSTSPCMVVPWGVETTTDDGRALLIEGKPSLIDHLAICAQGVWDKASDPVGVRVDSVEEPEVATKDETKAPTVEELQAQLDAANARADSAEAALAAKDDSDGGDKDEDTKDDSEKEGAKDETKDDSDKSEDDKDEKKEEAKADSADLTAIRASIADLGRKIPKALSDADMNELAAAQERADGVASAFGERASRPMPGETPLSYRRRLVTKYQDHSTAWKGVDLSVLPPKAFENAERAIYADAETAATAAVLAQPGTLRERVRSDDAGRRIKEYEGDPAAWMDSFKMQPKFIDRINSNRREA